MVQVVTIVWFLPKLVIPEIITGTATDHMGACHVEMSC